MLQYPILLVIYLLVFSSVVCFVLWYISLSSVVSFLVHHGCSSEPLGPHPPRFTTETTEEDLPGVMRNVQEPEAYMHQHVKIFG